MTYRELAEGMAAALREAGRESPERLVRDYLDDVGVKRGGAAIGADPLQLDAARVARDTERLCAGEPLQYVVGVAHFYGLRLAVGPGVLVPRPETEELVRWILERHDGRALHFADLCTGSGCIAVALAARRPSWSGVAVDVSARAISYAHVNLERAGVADRVDLLREDLLASPSAVASGPAVDLIVSNPPYIPEQDWHRVDRAVADYEPALALRVPQADPLVFYRVVVELAATRLRGGGWLYVESNDRYATAVADLFASAGLSEVQGLADMQGRPRHVRARMPD